MRHACRCLMPFGFIAAWALDGWAQDPSDAIFDENTLSTFTLTMDPGSWDAICYDGTGVGSTWQRADMTWQSGAITDTLPGVGVKRAGKGTTVADYPKPPINISVNEFEFANPAGPGTPGRMWRGVNRVKLDSMHPKDYSMMRERISYWTYNQIGAPAPRACHAKLYVNGDYKGVYCLQERVRKDFARYRWGEENGNFYDVSGWGNTPYGWRGTDPALYMPDPFSPQSNYPGGDHTDIVGLCDILNNVPADQIRSRLDGYINLDAFLSHIAANTSVSEGDGIVRFGDNSASTNNHWWYHRAGTNKMEIIKWDADESLGNGESDLSAPGPLTQVGIWDDFQPRPSVSWIPNDSVASAAYKAKIRQLIDGPWSSAVYTKIDSVYNQIRDAAYTDPYKGISTAPWGNQTGFSNAQFDAGVVWLKDWIRARAANLRSQVGNTTTLTNNAQFVSQNVPSGMTAGQTYSVSVTMQNTGTTTWTDTSYRLGSQNPTDTMTWGMNRVSMNAGASIAPNQQATFTWTVTAPATASTYNFQWQMRQSGVEWFGDLTPNVAVTVSTTPPPPPPGTDNAEFVSQDIPAAMTAGQSYTVMVTMRNSGTTTWTAAGGYRLNSRGPYDNMTWGLNHVNLASSDSIAPGQSKTFTFTMTAPTTPGTYLSRWSLAVGTAPFGATTPDVNVTVTTTPPPPGGNAAQFVSQSVPSTLTAGQTYSVSVTMQNTGTSTWTDTSYRLGSQNPTDNMTWGMNRVSLPTGASIAPGQQATFTWTVTAPSTAGTYNFQWQMRQSGVEWFGDLTPNVAVSVSTTPPPGDTDGDGLPDAWEMQYFGDLSQTGSGDPDGDGATNLQEYLGGSNPMDAASVPPAGGSGGGGGGGGCGATGFEAVLLLGLLLAATKVK